MSLRAGIAGHTVGEANRDVAINNTAYILYTVDKLDEARLLD